MTYLLMSVPFVGVALVVFCVGALHARNGGSLPRYLTSWAMASIALLVLTAVFDNVMIAAGFFEYGAEEISGLRLGLIPLEDLLYPLAAGLLLAGVWQLFRGNQVGESNDV